MTRMPINQEPFQGVGAGQRAVLNIHPGQRLFGLQLNHTANQALGTAAVIDAATMQTNLTKIELLIGNKPQRTFSAEELIMLTQFVGGTYRNGFLNVDFGEADRSTFAGDMALAWGTGNLVDPALQVRVTLASGLFSPALTCLAEVDNAVDPKGNPIGIGAIVKVYETSFNVSAAGSFTWVPDISRGDKIRRVHIKDSNAITSMQVFANKQLEYDCTTAQNIERLKKAAFVPQSNWTHVAFDIDKWVLGNFDTARLGTDGQLHLLNSAQFRFVFNGSGNFNVVYETIGPPD